MESTTYANDDILVSAVNINKLKKLNKLKKVKQSKKYLNKHKDSVKKNIS